MLNIISIKIVQIRIGRVSLTVVFGYSGSLISGLVGNGLILFFYIKGKRI